MSTYDVAVAPASRRSSRPLPRPSPTSICGGLVSAAVFDDAYPGGGATLGSAITRAYAAGRALART